jgi:hypothetical protein
MLITMVPKVNTIAVTVSITDFICSNISFPFALHVMPPVAPPERQSSKNGA